MKINIKWQSHSQLVSEIRSKTIENRISEKKEKSEGANNWVVWMSNTVNNELLFNHIRKIKMSLKRKNTYIVESHYTFFSSCPNWNISELMEQTQSA